MRACERLLNYVTIPTPSDETSTTLPSSACQFNLARELARECTDLGLSDVQIDEHCYVYAHIPPTKGYEHKPSLGFISHLDTVADFCHQEILPLVTPNYDGLDLPLGGSQGRILSPDMFPHLKELKGRTLITSNGDTILGADDKAGIAEIMTMAERILAENLPHGPISIAFTPDEEIGSGAAHLDLKKFNAEFAYTMDGDTEGEIQYENFNAAKATFLIHGVNVHPSSGKNILVNAGLVAMELNSLLPQGETPRDTEQYEGFYHLVDMKGEVAQGHLHYIVRDHDWKHFETRLNTLKEIAEQMNKKWGAGTVELTITQQYKNMAQIIENGHMHLIENAKKAWEAAGVRPIVLPIRGGTDGAQLSFRGLPCPNLGTGGHGYHGPYEHITAEGMDRTVDMMVELVQIYAQS